MEHLDSMGYAKCIGYGAPEKKGGPNTLFVFGRPTEKDPEGIYRSTDAGKTWVCINTDHLYGGTGNGNYICGDMNEFGTMYMSTVGCGIVYGRLSDGTSAPQTPATSKPTTAPVTTAKPTTAPVTTAKPTTAPVTTAKPTSAPAVTTAKPTTAPVTTPGASAVSVPGDVNLDGKVDISDLSALAIALVDKTELKPAAAANADVDKSGKVALADLARIRQYLSHVIEAL